MFQIQMDNTIMYIVFIVCKHHRTQTVRMLFGIVCSSIESANMLKQFDTVRFLFFSMWLRIMHVKTRRTFLAIIPKCKFDDNTKNKINEQKKREKSNRNPMDRITCNSVWMRRFSFEARKIARNRKNFANILVKQN